MPSHNTTQTLIWRAKFVLCRPHTTIYHLYPTLCVYIFLRLILRCMPGAEADALAACSMQLPHSDCLPNSKTNFPTHICHSYKFAARCTMTIMWMMMRMKRACAHVFCVRTRVFLDARPLCHVVVMSSSSSSSATSPFCASTRAIVIAVVSA